MNEGRKGDHSVADGAADAATGRHGLDHELRVRQQRTERLAHVAIERRLPVQIFIVFIVVTVVIVVVIVVIVVIVRRRRRRKKKKTFG